MANWWNADPVDGDWYKCATAGSGYGACTETLTPCTYIDTYRRYVNVNPNTPPTCEGYCDFYYAYGCSANNGGASVCGTQSGQ